MELSTSAFGAGYGNALSGVLQFNQRTGNDREFRTNFRVGASEAALTAEGPLFRGDDGTSNTTFIVIRPPVVSAAALPAYRPALPARLLGLPVQSQSRF